MTTPDRLALEPGEPWPRVALGPSADVPVPRCTTGVPPLDAAIAGAAASD